MPRNCSSCSHATSRGLCKLTLVGYDFSKEGTPAMEADTWRRANARGGALTTPLNPGADGRPVYKTWDEAVKDALCTRLKTGPRAGRWSATYGTEATQILTVGRQDFIQIAVNHCYKILGLTQNVAHLIDHHGLCQVHLTNDDVSDPYDVLVRLDEQGAVDGE